MRYLKDLALLNDSLPNYSHYFRQIEGEHEKYKNNYEWLERDHEYIQWWFPNHYPSQYNEKSTPLSYLEVKLFKKSRKIGFLLLKSTEIFLNFLGLRLSKTGKLYIISENRLTKCLLKHPHNCKRITRLLACLSITGFHAISIELGEFLLNLVATNERFQCFKSEEL